MSEVFELILLGIIVVAFCVFATYKYATRDMSEFIDYMKDIKEKENKDYFTNTDKYSKILDNIEEDTAVNYKPLKAKVYNKNS